MIDLGRPYAFDRDFCSSRDISQLQLFVVVVGSECVRTASSMRIRQLVVLINKHLFVRWCVSERGAETHNWRVRWCSAREVAGSPRARPIWWAMLRFTKLLASVQNKRCECTCYIIIGVHVLQVHLIVCGDCSCVSFPIALKSKINK